MSLATVIARRSWCLRYGRRGSATFCSHAKTRADFSFRSPSPSDGMSFLPATTSSWFPGHMAAFTRQLPSLLAQTHVVLEVRDVRLPLTSINPSLEAALDKWRKSRAASTADNVCERIVVYTKRDLIDGGEEVGDCSKRGAMPFAHWNCLGSAKRTVKTL